MENIFILACGQNLTSGNVFYNYIKIITIFKNHQEPNKDLYKMYICHPDILTNPDFFKQCFNMFEGILLYIFY